MIIIHKKDKLEIRTKYFKQPIFQMIFTTAENKFIE
jgi:hypothetical protein